MKKRIFLVLTLLLLLVGGYLTLDAYLCSHLYYGWGPFSTCSGGQGAGLNMLGTFKNRSLVLVALGSAIPLLLTLFVAQQQKKRVKLIWLLLSLIGGTALYMIVTSAISGSLLGAARLIQLFHVLIVYALLVFFVVAITALGDRLFELFKWNQEKNIHNVFLRFAFGLIAFSVGSVLLLMLQLYFGVVIRLIVLAFAFLIWKRRVSLSKMGEVVEEFVYNTQTTFTSKTWLGIAYFGLIAIICVYIFMGFNLAFIPYSTAWDANHAYLFFPRAWSLNNGLYWGNTGATTIPYLWYGFLTFWYKLGSSFIGNGFFGISPDGLAVIMNFWSGPLVLLAFVFLLHSFTSFLEGKHGERVNDEDYKTGKAEKIENKKGEDKKTSSTTIGLLLSVGVLLMILWLSSGMGAFLVFVDNKTDLALMFFSILALYAGIQFITHLNVYIDDKKGENDIDEGSMSTDKRKTHKKNLLQWAIISGILFAASAVAKPTGMLDFVHFGILFLLQWQVLLFGFGAYILVLGAIGLTQMMMVSWFLSVPQSRVLIGIGLAIVIVAVLLSFKKKGWREYLRYFLIWVATIVAGIVLYKGPFLIINSAITGGTSVPNVIRAIFLGKNTQQKPTLLLASNVSVETLQAIDAIEPTIEITGEDVAAENTGSVQHINGSYIEPAVCRTISNTDDLYTGLKEVIGSAANEDLGRYIGYGWKVFNTGTIFSLLPDGCYSLQKDAQYLCTQTDALKDINMSGLVALLQNAPQTPRIIDWLQQASASTGDLLQETALIAAVNDFMQSNSILKHQVDGATQVNVPYKYLLPFNVTFNWSLQNLSSYYTDIGIIWLLGLGLVFLGLLYALIDRKRQLAVISLVTLGAWAVWSLVASGIIWYSLGLIVWTILGMVAYFYYIYKSVEKTSSFAEKVHLYAIAGVFLVLCFVQLTLNFVRIASQGGSGPFIWYKGSVGEVDIIDENMTNERVQKVGYSAKDVFDLQFPHYNPILSKINAREKGDGVVIAGTYMQYFIDDQNNVGSDGFLTNFWQNASDNNTCNTYRRIVDKGTKYLVIDPNIASVVMGGGNSTLLDRFFAVVDDNGNLVQHGALTMLQQLVQDGYLKMFSTNNLVTKYSFIASDEELSTLLGVPVGEQLLLERAKMSAARYFPNINSYATAATQILAKRIETFEGIEDIADVVGKEIDVQKVTEVAKGFASVTSQEQASAVVAKIQDLTNDERFVLQYFLAVQQSKTSNPANYRQYITSLITSSVSNGSQVMAFQVQ